MFVVELSADQRGLLIDLLSRQSCTVGDPNFLPVALMAHATLQALTGATETHPPREAGA